MGWRAADAAISGPDNGLVAADTHRAKQVGTRIALIGCACDLSGQLEEPVHCVQWQVSTGLADSAMHDPGLGQYTRVCTDASSHTWCGLKVAIAKAIVPPAAMITIHFMLASPSW